ncbi:hypothetical protein HN51_016743 [Arachis hypogaea]
MTSLRSNPYASRWIDSGAPSPPNLNAISGKGRRLVVAFKGTEQMTIPSRSIQQKQQYVYTSFSPGSLRKDLPGGFVKKKLRNSFKRKGRQSNSNVMSLEIEDFRDAGEAKIIDEFHQALILDELLPSKHDDYHMLLRFILSNACYKSS